MTMNPDHSITADIAVTEAMLRDGARQDCCNCPVALAVCSAIPIGKHVHAGPSHLWFRLGDTSYVAGTPVEFIRLMRAFDKRKPCHPVSASVTFRRFV